MKKLSFKGFIAGFVVCSILSTGLTVFGETSQTIQAVFGRVKLVVNGSNVDKETLLYNGTTYLPLRDVAEITGLNVNWDGDANIATLTTATTTTTTPKTETAQPKKEIAYYPDYNTVPDYGKMFGIEPFEATSQKENFINMAYAYRPNNSTNENMKEYIKVLESVGFTKLAENAYYKGNITVFANRHTEKNILDIVIIMPIDDNGDVIPKNTSTPKVEAKQPENNNSSKITLAEFNEIDNGMSYSEVVQIIGGSGELMAETDLDIGAEYISKIYTWEGTGSLGANANIQFQGGKVISKAQYGLQ